MTVEAELFERFKAAKEEFSQKSRAFVKVRDSLPPKELRSKEEDFLYFQVQREYSLACKAFKREQRIFRSRVGSITHTSILDSVATATPTLNQIVREVKTQELLSNDPAARAIAEAAARFKSSESQSSGNEVPSDMEVPFEN